MGAYHWVPASHLKFVSESSADLAIEATKKFGKELPEQIEKIAKAFREPSVQKEKKPTRAK